MQFELRKWHALRLKEEKDKGLGTSPVLGSPSEDNQDQFAPPKTGFFNTLGMSFDERKALHARKAAWKKSHVETRVPTDAASRTGSASRTETSSTYSAEEDAEFEGYTGIGERTSNGNADDDARIEDAIRASVNQVRSMGQGLPGAKAETHEDEDLSITDEEYQQLIEKAIHQSMSSQELREDPLGSDDEDLKRVLEESKNPIVRGYGSDDDEDLKRVLEESKQPGPARQTGGDDDEELRRAIEESMTAHQDEENKQQAAKTEEDIVLEYVKKQSLAEEEAQEAGRQRQGQGQRGHTRER